MRSCDAELVFGKLLELEGRFGADEGFRGELTRILKRIVPYALRVPNHSYVLQIGGKEPERYNLSYKFNGVKGWIYDDQRILSTAEGVALPVSEIARFVDPRGPIFYEEYHVPGIYLFNEIKRLHFAPHEEKFLELDISVQDQTTSREVPLTLWVPNAA